MKIEIDLKDILQDDDYGSETLQDSIRRQVIEKIKAEVSTGISRKIDIEISTAIKDMIKESLLGITPGLINGLLDAEYVTVDRYGDRAKEPTTFRKQLVTQIHNEMVYRKANYDSEKNSFTRAVDEVVLQTVSQFKKEYNSLIYSKFTEEALSYATQKLQERLKIK